MKKIISVLLAIVLIIPVAAKFATDISKETQKAAFEKCSKAFHKLISNYDNGDYVSDIVLDEADGVKINSDDFLIPVETLIENCAEDISISTKSQTVNREYAEKLGFEVEINGDSVTLYQPYQTHRLIVKGENIDKLDSLDIIPYFDGTYIVQFDDLESTLAALEYYKKQDNIDFANPDVVVSIGDYNIKDENENEIEYSSSTSWGSAAIGFNTLFKARMGLAWFLPTVRVGVVDTGIYPSHEQLKDRVIDNNYNVSDTYAFYGTGHDDNGHGTHVAGIIAQNTLSNVKIIGFKVLNRNGAGSFSQIRDGIYTAYYAGCKVINLSLGGHYGTHYYDPGRGVFAFLEQNNVTCCVAAGNEGRDCFSEYPAQYSECITVAAMDENDEIPEWSNYGKCVDIIAPGVDISSAYYLSDNKYIELSGTSMATPFVTAAAANILSKNPDATPQEIKEFLQINGRDINAPERFYGKPALYLGSTRSFNMYEQPEEPTYSLEEGECQEGTKLKINKTSGSDIYYQIYDYDKYDNEYKLKTKTKYSDGIILDHPCVIVAVASYKGFLDSCIAQSKFYVKYNSDEGRFTIDENGTITAYSGNSSNLVIPEKINGITVKAIGDNVFTQRDNIEFVNSDEHTNFLRTVTLPETCTDINYYAFFGCKYMTDVFGGNIQKIGTCAFSHCEVLSNIDISEVKTIAGNGLSNSAVKEFVNSSIENIEHCAFGGCKSLEYVSVPNVKTIGRDAFGYCENLSSISLGNNLSDIGEFAFDRCEGLESITLGNDLKSIGRCAFRDCESLTDVYFNGIKKEWNRIEIGNSNECLKNANIHFTAYSTDNYTLLSAFTEAKDYSNAEYTKESLESLNDLVDKYDTLAESGVSQETLDAATAEILNAILNLDALSNYEITSFDGKEIELMNKDGKTTELTFEDFVNENCESLDVVDDGVINAKDYAYLLRNY